MGIALFLRLEKRIIWWYNQRTITTKLSREDLIDEFLKKGGRINKYYLQDWNRSKPALVYFKGWFSGKNCREAILKALA